ncbi:MAG: hypothetical protein K2G64_07090 [Muribaculaceae bacterium]|nr:hypothetical protein [Muribaculaceae bacterium]MDE5968854.1 hypothetical protein [Muribaculaceae bacterium]
MVDTSLWKNSDYNVMAVVKRNNDPDKTDSPVIVIELKEPHRPTKSRYRLQNLKDNGQFIKARCIDEGRNDFGVDAEIHITDEKCRLILHQPSNIGDYELTFDFINFDTLPYLAI